MTVKSKKWTVGYWMTENPETIHPGMSVREAFFRMRLEGFHHYPVLEDGKLVGIISDRDLRRPDVTKEPDGWDDLYDLDPQIPARDIMTEEVRTLKIEDSLEDALQLINDHNISCVPVVDEEEKLVGILTSHDLNEAFLALLEQLEKPLRSLL